MEQFSKQSANTMSIEKHDQTIQLVDGTFTPSEALDVITSLIDQKINFHKLQRISWYEKNENCETKYPDDRIEELMREKEIAKNFLNPVRGTHAKIRIDGILKIQVEE